MGIWVTVLYQNSISNMQLTILKPNTIPHFFLLQMVKEIGSEKYFRPFSTITTILQI